MLRQIKSTRKQQIITLASSNILLQVLSTLYRMMLSRLVGSEALGLSQLVMQIYSIAVSICISGMNVSVVTLASRLKDEGAAAVRKLCMQAFSVYAVLFLSMGFPVFIFRKIISTNLIGDAATTNSLILVLICIFMTGLENLLKSIHIGTGRVRTTAFSELTEQSARFAIVFLLFRSMHSTSSNNAAAVFFMMLGMVLSEFFSVGYLLISYIRNYCGDGIVFQRSIRAEYISVLLPATLTGIASTLFESVAALLLPARLLAAGYTRQAALSIIGILNTSAIPLVMFPMSIVGAVTQVSLPSVSYMAWNQNYMGLKRLLKKCIVIIASAFLLLNVLPLSFLPRLAQVLFKLTPGRSALIILTVKSLIIYFQLLVAMALNGMMMQKKVLFYAVIGEIIQLMLIYTLSANPFLHIYGYLIAMCIGEGVRLLLSIVALQRELARHSQLQAKKRANY